MLSIKLFSVLDKDPCGSKVLERYVLVSSSEVRVGKDQSDREIISLLSRMKPSKMVESPLDLRCDVL